MSKILGLDLGTNSIGWAVVDDENKKILGTGIRIFPEGVIAKTIGTGDKEVSKNASRRESRQTRRGFYRQRLRRIKLLETLIEFKMCPLTNDELKQWKQYDKKKGQSGKTFPSSPEFINWLKLNPYELRTKALNEDISLFELGRIFYHLIQRRGFLSNRKGNADGKIFTGKDNMTGIDETLKHIKDKTLGVYLNSILPKENEPYKNIIDINGKELRARGRYTLRDMYVDEFEKIWNRQAKQLKIEVIQKKVQNVSVITGSIFSKRNKHRIEKLQVKKGKENVIIEGNKLIVNEYIPLKNYLAGEIYYDEEGIIKHNSQDSILFYQRSLRSQKGLLAKCSFEGMKFYDKKNKRWRIVGPTPCPLSHPEYEEFRALQFINNIEYGAKNRLDENQRQMLTELFNKKDAAFDFILISKELKLTFEKFNYSDEYKVSGNYTNAKLSKLFKENIWDEHKEEIWHCFYSFKDNDKLIQKLKDDYGLIDKDKVEKIKLKDGYSNVSLKAIRNITPFLKKGYKFSDAVLLGGVRNAFKTTDRENNPYDRWENFKDEHEKIEKDIIRINKDKKNKEGDAIKRVKEYLHENYGFENEDKNFKKLYHHSQEIEQKKINNKLDKIENLRNPIVQQGLNELRRLVNTLLEEHKVFDKIKVELGRNLKIGKKQRQETEYKIRENNKKNEEARQKLTEYGLAHSRDNVQKYLLWKEIEDRRGGGVVQCPYTNKTINISDLLNEENRFQIEHIFPRSTSLDDSFGNKTLCDAKFNGLKGNKTPYQFYKENSDAKLWGGANSWEEIKQRAFKLLPYAKAKRFTAEKIDEKDEGFIERQLNDTRYMSKKAKEILSEICPKDNIRVMPGSVTSELRHLWGLNNILQPVEVLDFKNAKISIDKAEKHWVVFDENGAVQCFYPMYNEKPILKENEIAISGSLNNKGVFSSKYITRNSKHDELEGEKYKGEYWKKLKLSSEPLYIEKMFTDKPEVEANEIVLRGKVSKKYFENETIGKKIKTEFEDGFYWAKFQVNSIKFEKPVPKKQPKKASGQILLYGTIKDAVFKSYIYECQTGKADGNYWAIIDLDFNTVNFSNTMNQKPEIDDNTILIQGSVNEYGLFSSDIDNAHSFETNKPQGKYWTIFEIKEEDKKLYPQLNIEPELQDKQMIAEGTVWVDKYTGEIKFDPKKNRDDHRHHAIDAITIALTEQAYLQKLSTYNAQLDEKHRGKAEKPTFDIPWESFYSDVKNAVSEIIVSYKENHKVLTKINKKIHKNGKKILSKGFAVSGQLHKENVYGKRQAPNSEKPYFHIRKSVAGLEDKQINKIVDPRIRNIILKAKAQEKKIKEQIDELNKHLKKAKTDFDEKDFQKQIDDKQHEIKLLYTLPNKNGEPVPIKKVRIKENLGNMEQLKDKKVFAEKKGEDIELNQYVNPRNNHHVAIYKNAEGELFEKVVTFWEAVERKKGGLPVIDKALKDGSEFVTSLEINDMFLLGVNDEDINWNVPNYKYLTKHVFRVQKISSSYYTFRHHLASTLDNFKQQVSLQSFKAWKEANPIKVKIDILGRILKVD